MGKGKGKGHTIYNIEQINMEIDYDKLAEAIVKAQTMAKTLPEEDHENKNKFSLWQFLKRVWAILCNKADTHGNMTVGAFTFPIYVLFKLIAILGFIFCLGILVYLIAFAVGMNWSTFTGIITNIYVIAIAFMCVFILFVYAVMVWGAANEIHEEEDKNYIVAIFSGVVSFVALIVSLVALFQGD